MTLSIFMPSMVEPMSRSNIVAHVTCDSHGLTM